MSWILFCIQIIQLISAIPGLIKAIREILKLIKELPKDEQKDAKDKLLTLAKDAKSGKIPVGSQSPIHKYRDELKARVGKV